MELETGSEEEAMAAPIEMKCPDCERVLKVPPAVFGKKIKCKHCGHAFVVHDPSARPAKGSAQPESGAKPSSPAPAAKNPFLDDDDDEGPAKIEVIKEDDSPRCPHCAQELDPPDAALCIHCGFNNITRAAAEVKKVWAPTFEDWFMHLLPGIIALAICITLIVVNVISLLNMREWLEGTFLEMDDKDAAGRKRYIVPPGFFIALIMVGSLVIFVPSIKFVYRRLIVGYMPPEKVKL